MEAILSAVVVSSRFSSFELDKHRSYLPGVPKAHYGFTFNSATKTKYSGKILLDILVEDSVYPELTEKIIRTKWIETDGETKVTVPSIDAITGDKLTAFAPNTTGIPFFKTGQSFSMEICTQLYDLGKLFEQIKDVKVVASSFYAFAKKEIAYRRKVNPVIDLGPENVLQDIIDTCLIIAKRGSGTERERTNFKELQRGIIAFGTGFLCPGISVLMMPLLCRHEWLISRPNY